MSENERFVFITNKKGNKIINKDGLVLVQNMTDKSFVYVKPIASTSNTTSMQPLTEKNANTISMNTPHISSQVQPTVLVQSQELFYVDNKLGEKSNEDCNPKVQVHVENEEGTNDKFWSHDSILALMAAYKDHLNSFQMNTKGHNKIWKKISALLHASGYKYIHKQCENKFKNLKKRYHAKIDNMKSKQNGASVYRFDYFDIFHETFGHKPNVEPVALASSTRGSASLTLDTVKEETIFDDENNENHDSTNDECKRKRRSETPTRNKGKRTKLETVVDEMKKVTDEKMKQQDFRQQKLIAAFDRQTDRLICSIEKLIDKL